MNEVNKKWKLAERARFCGVYLIDIAGIRLALVRIRATFVPRLGSFPLASGKWS